MREIPPQTSANTRNFFLRNFKDLNITFPNLRKTSAKAEKRHSTVKSSTYLIPKSYPQEPPQTSAKPVFSYTWDAFLIYFLDSGE
jgi:hypothetical protein